MISSSLFLNCLSLSNRGHPLEGSCQEVKCLRYTPFAFFFRGMLHGIPPPSCRLGRARVFSAFGCGHFDAAPHTHQDQGSWRSRLWARPLPLTPSCPKKTFGTLPCPIVIITDVMAPLRRHSLCGSRQKRRQLNNSVSGHLKGAEVRTNQTLWFLTIPYCSLTPQPQRRVPRLAKRSGHIKRDLLAHDVITSPSQLMSHSSVCHGHLCLGCFALVKTLNLRIKAHRKMGRLTVCPA